MKIKPVLKWVGGKRQLIPYLNKIIPKKFNNYFEPFVGGGALFMNLKNKNTTINDVSKELIDVYISIKKDPFKLMRLLNIHEKNHLQNPIKYYYFIRAKDKNDDWSKINIFDKAARLIYLNKSCFNGLYRVNKSGYFNVPFNGKSKIKTYNKENILALSVFLKESVTILNEDFEKACENAKKGDLIFFDPPYDILKKNTFHKYTKENFGVKEQKRLAKVAHDLKKRGCYVIVTNHNTKLINELYKDFKIDVVKVKRMINSDAKKRNGVETIIHNC